jgi:hypothetical protein
MVFQKPAFNLERLVTKAQDKLAQPVSGAMLHDVPQYGFATNGNHWLGKVLGRLA